MTRAPQLLQIQTTEEPMSETATIERYRKSPEQLCGELLAAFANSVESQLEQGHRTEAEQTAIVQVMESADLAIRDDVAEAILKLEAEEEAGKQAAKMRADYAKSRGALARRIKWSVLEYMKDKGITRVSSEEHLFRVTKNPTKTKIIEAILPDEYKKPETKMVPDREKIERDLDEGIEIPGASYEQTVRLDVK